MAGSSLLREFGAFIAHQIRVSDVGIRYGGDEFVLVLPQTSQESALQFTARLKERLALHDFLKDRDLKVKLTASFGVATFPGNGQTVDELISAADQAMYHVKRGKKNGIYAPAQSSLLLSSLGIKNPGKT